MSDLLAYGILNLLFVLGISPLFVSLIKKVKAYAQGRKGPSLFQTYYSLAKLLKKEAVYSANSSWVMRATPWINIVVLLAASLFVPLAFIPQPVGTISNIILFLYLLALAKFFMALSGLDAGSTFGGMGSSREMSVSAIIEPVNVLTFAALAFSLKTLSVHEMFRSILAAGAPFNPILLLISISLFVMLIVETSRIPVDNPETHLELTMIHEAMILEQSGKNLAMMEASHAIKQTLLMGLLVNILFPWGLATGFSALAVAISIGAFIIKGAVLSVIVGLFESLCAKSRLFRLPDLFMIAFFISFITLIIEVFA